MKKNTFKLGQAVHYSGKNYLVSHIEDGYVQLKYKKITKKVIDLFNSDIAKISV